MTAQNGKLLAANKPGYIGGCVEPKMSLLAKRPGSEKTCTKTTKQAIPKRRSYPQRSRTRPIRSRRRMPSGRVNFTIKARQPTSTSVAYTVHHGAAAFQADGWPRSQ